jgi:hypothetical protein
LYLQNKYTQWYYNIVTRAKTRKLHGYSERHHIIPHALGGTDQFENIAILTAREHFICHWLLTKMLPDGKHKWKMMHAFNGFNRANKNQNRYVPNSIQYEIMKKAASEARSELNKGNKYAKGYKRSNETIEKWRSSRGTFKHTEETKARQSNTMKLKYKLGHNPLSGKTFEEKYGTDEAAKRREKLKGPRGPRTKPPGPQKLITCPHCKKTGGTSNMKRYHFDNCVFQ